MVSTPYAPNGLFEKIEHEPEETCTYKRIFLDYTYGLDKMYTKEEIEKAKQSPSFEREYNLKDRQCISYKRYRCSFRERSNSCRS